MKVRNLGRKSLEEVMAKLDSLGFKLMQDLLALNNALSKPVSTNPENVAPQTPEQNAIADGYAPDSPAPVVQQTSARTTTSNGHNPFRN